MDGRALLMKLYRELRPSLPIGQKHVYDCKHWKYIMSLAKANRETKDPKVLHFGRTYLTYLESSRKYEALHEKYRGQGERSSEELARLMGFRMPNDPKEPHKNKSSEQ